MAEVRIALVVLVLLALAWVLLDGAAQVIGPHKQSRYNVRVLRFSLRTLLITMTLLAAGLGVVVWAVR
jgi:hypothetical protein